MMMTMIEGYVMKLDPGAREQL